MAINPSELDTEACAREPIHIPGRIQPHGYLLAAGADGKISHASKNLAELKAGIALGESLKTFFGELYPKVEPLLHSPPSPQRFSFAGNDIDLVCHQNGGIHILEMEKAPPSEPSFSSIYQKVNMAIQKVETSRDLEELWATTAREARVLTGYDRVMIYRFDRDWNGKVIAEDKADHLEPFLGLQYPASDIPAQARALYEKNWIRSIPDVAYEPVEILSEKKEPLDLSFSFLRSVSPVHVQYLKNMGVGASMSLSVIKESRLWGLIAFHHGSARYLPYELRQGLEFLAKFFSLQIAAKEKRENLEYRQELHRTVAQLHQAMAGSRSYLSALLEEEPGLLSFIKGVTGAAVIHRGKFLSAGKVPQEEWIRELSRFIEEPIFVTESLARAFPEAKPHAAVASGLLALSIPEVEPAYVFLFKPEVIQTVNWAGKPEKLQEGSGSLNPRKSFDLWQERVRLTSRPWQEEEVLAAENLRRRIIEVDLERQLEVVKQSNEELDQFAHAVAHDLKEPLRGIEAFSRFLAEDLGETLEGEPAENLSSITELAVRARNLTSDLYDFARLGRQDLEMQEVDLNIPLQEALSLLEHQLKETDIEVPRPLPKLRCDPVKAREIFQNLISNAVKYNENKKKKVRIEFRDSPTVIQISDNGIGIPEKDSERIFRVFERLHGPNEYGGGSGSGLAIVKRIIDLHGGKIWIDHLPQGGTRFSFTFSPSI